MEVPSERPAIEFIDTAPIEAPTPEDPRPVRNRRATVLLGGVAIMAACVLVASALSGRPANQTTPTNVPAPSNDATSPTVSDTTPSDQADAASVGGDVELDDFVPWPSPPADHNPTVIGIPGPEVPLIGNITEMSVVYVNTLGRPTIIDLDTGWVEQVDVAETRSYDFFGVEFGRIVSFDGRNDNVRPATDRSLLFHTHRAGSLTELEDVPQSVSPAPHLCLSSQPCPIDRWTFDRVTNGTDTIRRANADDDPLVMEMLFGESWSDVRGTRTPPADSDYDLRVPAPLRDEAWIVHQPGSEAWRRMTRVN